MDGNEGLSERIERMRGCYLDDVAGISIERARYYTESWKETEGSGEAKVVRVALAMKNVIEKMTHNIYPDDRIAGNYTEFFLGIPIDVERGLWNEVFEVELKKSSMIKYILKSNIRFILYMIRKYGLMALYRGIKETSAVGAAMPNIGTATLDKRKKA